MSINTFVIGGDLPASSLGFDAYGRPTPDEWTPGPVSAFSHRPYPPGSSLFLAGA